MSPPRPPPQDPVPASPPSWPALCTLEIPTMTNLQALDPPRWCRWFDMNATLCERAYVGLQDDGTTHCATQSCTKLRRCTFEPVSGCMLTDSLVACSLPPTSPLPPQLPPTSPSPSQPIERILHDRFMYGQPANRVELAGILVHMFDLLGRSLDQPWLPCREDNWCYKYSDRLSFSIINAELPYLFNQKYAAGFIASPTKADLLCSWFIDYGTMDKLCDPPGVRNDCLPGCWVGTPNWCSGQPDHIWDCAFPPSLTKEMLENHMMRMGRTGQRHLGAAYNEVILSWKSLVRNLPESIEAFFFVDWGAEDLARRAHERFLNDHPGSKVPLLFMDMQDGENVFTRA